MNYRLVFITTILLYYTSLSFAQTGCTDPYASNYSATATINDGSCVYPVTHDTMALRAVLPAGISESSGLAWSDGKLWTHNDSGNPNTFFNIDTSDGHILQTVHVDNHTNVDWEDITADNDYIYLSDLGNNNGDRTDLRVLKIAKADIGTGTSVHVNAEVISVSYSDQTSFTANQFNNFDCEAIISIGDSLYIFTKDRGDQKTRVYKMPKVPGTYSLSPYTSYNVGGLITGASYNANTHEIVLLGYTLLKTYSFLWFLNDYSGDMFFSGNKRRIEIGGNTEWQTEGVEFISANRFFISNETATVSASLFIGEKNWLTNLGVNNPVEKPAFEVYPSPFTNNIFVQNISGRTNYCVTDLPGRKLATGVLEPGKNSIKLEQLRPGVYMLQLETGGVMSTQRILKE